MSDMEKQKNNELSSGEAALMLNVNGVPDEKSKTAPRGRARSRIVWIFLAVFVLLFLAMTALYIVERLRKTDKKPPEKKIQHASPTTMERLCRSAECFESASDIMSSIDPKEDPCEDFYAYACNGFIQKHPVPKDEISVDNWSLLTKKVDKFISKALSDEELKDKYKKITAVTKAFDFYHSCMNIKDTVPRQNNPVVAMINKYLPWPIVNHYWNDSDVDLSHVIAKVSRDFDSSPFFKVLVQTDLKNSTLNIVTVQQTFQWGLFPNQLTRNFTSAIKSQAEYRDLIYNVSLLLGANDTEQLKKDVWDIFDAEKKMANVGKGYGDFDEALYYGKYKVSQLQEKTKGLKVDWMKLLNEFLHDTKQKVTEDHEIIVTDLETVVKMMQNSIGTMSKRAILNYIGWRVIQEIYQYASQELDDLRINFRIHGWGLLAFNKEENCKHKTQENFPMAFSRIFVDEKFPKSSKTLAQNLAKSIQDVFQETLRDSEWMDDKSKAAAIEKADAVKGNYGYPDYIRDDAKFNAKMEQVNILKHSFLESMVSIMTHKKRTELMNLGKPVDRNEWTESPLLVNPYYLPMRNSINFPAAFLQPPFYDAKYLRAISYGGVGAIIAHELIHGFDISGKNFDKDGNNVKWWSDSTLAHYKNRTRCLVEQYNMFTLDVFPVDGEATLAENLADNVGVREAFKAYQRWVERNGEEPMLPGIFSNEQIFFLSYARNWCKNIVPMAIATEVLSNEHSPSRFRVNGPLQNFQEFSRVFKCRPGSNMNPAKKCATW